MELRHLRYFVAVAEEGSFSLGAARIHIAQPPLSQQIRQLESELGVVLFDRKNRPLRVTAAGMYLLEQATKILNEMDRLPERVQRAAREQTETLTISYVESAMYAPFPAILKSFRSKHRNVDVVLVNSSGNEQETLLLDKKVDIVFGRILRRNNSLVYQSLTKERLVAAIPIDHPLAEKRSVTAAEIGRHPIVLYPRPQRSHYARFIVSMLGERTGRKVTVAQESDHLHAALGLVAAGFGIAVVPESVQKAHINGVLYRKLRGSCQLTGGLIYRKGDSSPLLQVFLSECRKFSTGKAHGQRAS